MKRIVLMVVVAAGLLVPSAVLVSNAAADNPHGTPPGQGGDPNASCGHAGGGKPDDQCNSANLPFSEGCQHGQAPQQNPHCEGTNTTTTSTTPTTPSTSTPASQGVAGAQGQGGVAGESNNKQAANAAQGGGGSSKLPFTGLDTLWLALLGAGMLASGLALRARSGRSASVLRHYVGY
jgi:hypothetical protein